MDGRALLAARCRAQLLTGPPAGSAEDVVGRLLAVQSQDPRGFRLAVRTRSAGVLAADVDRALGERRLVVSWLNRGTLYLVRAEDFAWLHAVTTPQLAATSARRLEQEGLTPALADRGVDTVVGDVIEHGPRSRGELRDALEEAGVPTAGQALVHVLLAATLRHRLIRGPVEAGEHRMVLADDWLGAAEPEDRIDTLGRLARRYLEGHAPATDRDLAVWAGVPLRDARAGLAALGDAVVVDGDGFADLADRSRATELPPPRLLGGFDPVLHGWASREAVLGGDDGQVVRGGIFRAFALADGDPVGLWRIAGGRVRIRPFAPLLPGAREALLADAARVLEFLGMPEKDAVVEEP